MPIKPALAAVAEHIAGLLPLHLVYSQAHETAIEVFIISPAKSIHLSYIMAW